VGDGVNEGLGVGLFVAKVVAVAVVVGGKSVNLGPQALNNITNNMMTNIGLRTILVLIATFKPLKGSILPITLCNWIN
jgi:hypothetical protein